MSILPSVLSAAAQGADLEEVQEAAMFKERGSRILQMLLFVGLKYLITLALLQNSLLILELLTRLKMKKE